MTVLPIAWIQVEPDTSWLRLLSFKWKFNQRSSDNHLYIRSVWRWFDTNPINKNLH